MSIFYQKRVEEFRLMPSRDNTYPPHLHQQLELIVVRSGTVLVTIGGHDAALSAGQCGIVFPNQIHSLRTPERSRILLFIFDASFCGEYKTDFLSCLPEYPFFELDALSSFARDGLQGLCRLWIWPGVFPFTEDVHRRYTRGYMQVMLSGLFDLLALQLRADCGDLELSQRVLLYVETHYMEPLTLDTLASMFHVSRFTVSRIFSDKLRLSFSSYLTGWRLEKARELLLSQETLSVTAIAYESGFSSTRTFYRAFYNAYGITPRGYRLKRE